MATLCQVSARTEAAGSDAVPPQPPAKPHQRRLLLWLDSILKYPSQGMNKQQTTSYIGLIILAAMKDRM